MLGKIANSFSRGRYFLLAMFLAIVSTLGIISVSNLAHAAHTLAGTSSQVITPATTDGLPLNGTVGYQGASSDGNIVVFTSNATNLLGAGSSTYGLYTYNIKTNTTARVDVSTSGVAADDALFNAHGKPVRISETGRYITFMSEATNLIDGTTSPSNNYAIYRRDTQAGTTTQLTYSRLIDGYPDNYSRNLAVSNDGRFVLLASRYIASSYPYYYQTALGDNIGGTYSWTSVSHGVTNEGGGGSDNTQGSMSCDGAFIATNQTNTITLIDVRRGSANVVDISGSGTSGAPVLSCNGRYLLYATSNRTNITPTPSGMNSFLHLVRYDRITGERMYVDSNSAGVFSSGFGWYTTPVMVPQNVFNASVSDSGDVVFKFGQSGNVYLKHLSDGSGTLESVAITTSGTYVNSTNGEITQNGQYIFLTMDPYNLGLASSPSSNQIIRVKTNL